ncbi:MAG: adenylate/guanylate cyclase domain-containing protein [Planctomycetota bacterium]
MRTQTLSILISDLQGYTERQARSSREAIARDLARHAELLRPVFAAFRGRVVKSMGDAFLVVFDSPTDAVLAAVQVQKQLAQHNLGKDVEQSLHVRIGIATGEVSRDAQDDVFGDPVNLAARLQASAEPDAVWLAETTFLSMNRNEVQAFEVGARVFKGVPGEVKVYRVLDDCIRRTALLSREELDRAMAAPLARGRTRRVALFALGLLTVGVAAWFVLLDRRGPLERFASDPADLQAGDACARIWTTELYDAEERGVMETVYREGVMAQRIAGMAERFGGREAFDRLRAVYLMANEPLGPQVAEFVEGVVTRHAALRGDPRFRKLLGDTVEYAAKEPAIHAIYLRAEQALDGGG